MTSNVGSQFIAEMGPLGFIGEEAKNENRRESAREKVMTALREQFRPEFLNRVDEVIIFDYLGTEEIKKIVELEIAKVAKRMATQGIELEVTGKAKELLAERGFDQNLGARPLKRVIQKTLLNPLALKIVSGEIGPGSKVIIGVEKGEIDIQQALAMPSLKKESPARSGSK